MRIMRGMVSVTDGQYFLQSFSGDVTCRKGCDVPKVLLFSACYRGSYKSRSISESSTVNVYL